MNEQRLFSVSDLADKIGVPRTTITDWLGKYERFTEMRIQGKRRFYTEKTLAVLTKVSELRTEGHSLNDIKDDLEQIFQLSPQVETTTMSGEHDDASVSPENDSNELEQKQSMPIEEKNGENSDETRIPVVPSANVDAIKELVSSKFSDMCNTLNDVNQKAEKSSFALRLLFTFTMVVLLLLFGVLAFLYLNRQWDSRSLESRDKYFEALEKMNHSSEINLVQAVGGVSSDVQNIGENLNHLSSGLQEQKKEFDNMLQEQKELFQKQLTTAEQNFETKMALQKEIFAAEQLKWLKERDQLEQNHKKQDDYESNRIEEMRKLKRQLEEYELNLNSLKQEKEQLIQTKQLLEKEKEDLLKSVHDYQNELNTANDTRKKVIDDSKRIQEEYNSVKNELEKAKQQIEQLKSSANS